MPQTGQIVRLVHADVHTRTAVHALVLLSKVAILVGQIGRLAITFIVTLVQLALFDLIELLPHHVLLFQTIREVHHSHCVLKELLAGLREFLVHFG